MLFRSLSKFTLHYYKYIKAVKEQKYISMIILMFIKYHYFILINNIKHIFMF